MRTSEFWTRIVNGHDSEFQNKIVNGHDVYCGFQRHHIFNFKWHSRCPRCPILFAAPDFECPRKKANHQHVPFTRWRLVLKEFAIQALPELVCESCMFWFLPTYVGQHLTLLQKGDMVQKGVRIVYMEGQRGWLFWSVNAAKGIWNLSDVMSVMCWPRDLFTAFENITMSTSHRNIDFSRGVCRLDHQA